MMTEAGRVRTRSLSRRAGARLAPSALGACLFLFAAVPCRAGEVQSAVPETMGTAFSAPSVPLRIPRVLVLCSGERLLPANVLFDESLRAALASGGEPVETRSEFLDEIRFPLRTVERTRTFLSEKYDQLAPDVIVTFGSSSLDFWLHQRPDLFPGVPVVFAGDESRVPQTRMDGRITGVRSGSDPSATLRLALRLHPQTRQVFVIVDSTEASGAGEDWERIRPSGSHVPIRVLKAQTRADLLFRLSGLPPNSLALDLTSFDRDSRGAETDGRISRSLSEVSTAPVYGVFDPLAGGGLAGAVATPIVETGRATASLVRQVLSSGGTGALPPVRTLTAKPLFDWRQLKRWGALTSRVPPGSTVLFKPPTFWRQHLLLVFSTGTLFLLQSGLIVALVLQSRRRSRAEREARLRREELAHMTRVATMGELTASLAHEINQPLAAILSNAQAAQRLVAAGGAGAEEVGEILADIAADDRRAGEVIGRIRSLLRKEGTSLADVDVNELVGDVVGLVRGELTLRGVSLSLDLLPEPRHALGDRVQLQQVILNLIVNALDAMQDAPGGMRRLVIRTALGDARSVIVSVQDSGPGVPPEKLDQIFEPFVTTKLRGLGLGLSICRSTIQAHGGRIGLTNNADRGTTFWFTLPLQEGRKA